ncbi:hypothetical protein [Ralstonia chuxiongensis]|uniref:Uncharacterized protein n=1 Tax=Ralstonia chuxiongensis TaxID=2957504 RepID=A0AA42BKL1_9RALS|nr:hypothetical protein [Ralstonia chuxiongensis]MCP1172997.1 hypothetical protein [Ralstonia chuxiongensis]
MATPSQYRSLNVDRHAINLNCVWKRSPQLRGIGTFPVGDQEQIKDRCNRAPPRCDTRSSLIYVLVNLKWQFAEEVLPALDVATQDIEQSARTREAVRASVRQRHKGVKIARGDLQSRIVQISGEGHEAISMDVCHFSIEGKPRLRRGYSIDRLLYENADTRRGKVGSLPLLSTPCPATCSRDYHCGNSGTHGANRSRDVPGVFRWLEPPRGGKCDATKESCDQCCNPFLMTFNERHFYPHLMFVPY